MPHRKLTLLATLALVPALPPTIMAAEDDVPALVINTKSGTVDCTDRNVNVLASGAELAFTGRCNKVYFIGRSTKATVDSARLLQVSVGEVEVRVKGPLEEVFVVGRNTVLHLDKVGQLNLNSDDARIEAAEIGKLSAVGSRNTVHWSSGSPVINDIGSDNTLQPKR